MISNFYPYQERIILANRESSTDSPNFTPTNSIKDLDSVGVKLTREKSLIFPARASKEVG